MRQPATTSPTASAILMLVCALPDEALRPLLLRLLLQDGAASPSAGVPRETSPSSAATRRRAPVRTKAKRKPASATAGRSNLMANAAAAGARLAAQRLRDAAAKREKRRLAREGKANGANGAHTTNVAATPSATPAADPGAAERARHANVMRARRARDAARQTDGAANSTAAAETAAAFWKKAEALGPGKAFKVVARAFSINEAVALDAYRARELPPGLGPAEAAKLIAAPPTS
jgi:hypothetical protein